MTEKEHWKAKEKRLRLEAEALGLPNTPKVPESIQEEKVEWTVMADVWGVETKIITYKLSDTPDAEERACKVALKKNGRVI